MTAARAAHLLVRIDPRTREPLQNQIYASIRRAILDGVVAPGARLPSSRALAADLGISRTTTVLAFDQLAAEGYLTARGGSGTFVTRELPDDRPRAPAASRIVVPRHPPLSRRGLTLAATPRSAVKIEGAPRAFRIGTPGLDCFPTQVWTRLASRRLKSVTMAQLDYGDAAGLRALREAIADHVQRARGTSCTSEQVIVVTGAQHGLELISRLLVDPGDTVWMEEPGYPGARGALIAAGARPRPIPVDAHGLKIELGARRAGDARLVYVTPSHQFPLGVPLILARRLALLAWARAARAWIVEDDYDSEFRYGTRPIPCLHGLDVDGRVIYVGSFSKTLFPALRLGFLIVPTDLRDAVIGARRAADIHSAAMDQSVLADFIGGGHFERHLRRMRTEYGARLDALFPGSSAALPRRDGPSTGHDRAARRSGSARRRRSRGVRRGLGTRCRSDAVVRLLLRSARADDTGPRAWFRARAARADERRNGAARCGDRGGPEKGSPAPRTAGTS